MNNPHDFHPLKNWCTVCSVTELQLLLASRDSILWTECRPGVVGDYNQLTTGIWYEEIH